MSTYLITRLTLETRVTRKRAAGARKQRAPLTGSEAACHPAKWTPRLRVKTGSHGSVILTLKEKHKLQFETIHLGIRHRIEKQKCHNVESANP